MNKQSVILAVVISILLLSAYNLLDDRHDMSQHKDFFNQMMDFKEKMTAFKKQGGRNTSSMGRELCDRLNVLEFHYNDKTQLTDCELIYDQ